MLIDASTAFRVDPDWTYGFPGKSIASSVLSSCTFSLITPWQRQNFPRNKRKQSKRSKRIANPGCYPTGFIGLTRPLVDAGILQEGTPLTVNAISGYSGGGKGLMEIYEAGGAEPWGSYGFSLVSDFKCYYRMNATC